MVIRPLFSHMVLDTLDHPSLVEYSVDVEEIVIDKNTSKYLYNQESSLQIKVLLTDKVTDQFFNAI